MKRDAEIALSAYFEALSADPMPAIEVRIGRRISGPLLPLAAGVCAAALLPLLAPASKASAQPVTGVASLGQEEADFEPQSSVDVEDKKWLV